MDKLAQKFSAQEMIRANSEAEAKEMKRLQLQVSEYEKILQEIRKLNYKNTELSEKMDSLIDENAEKIHNMKEDEQKLILSLRDLTDEQIRNREAELVRREEERIEREKEAELKAKNDLEFVKGILNEKFRDSDDFVHKENVKVYRNVQAVVTDEIKKQTETIVDDNKYYSNKLEAKLNIIMALSIASIVVSLVNIILSILKVI